MKSLHKKRLLKLAAFIRTVPKKNFDLSWWVELSPTKQHDKQKSEKEIEKLHKIA